MARSTLRSFISGVAGQCGPIIIDVGTSSLTGIRRAARPYLQQSAVLAHPTMETLALSASDCAVLGSHCARAGFLFDGCSRNAETFIDSLGVEWQRIDGALTPVHHPLEHATYREIASYRRPIWPQLMQAPDASRERSLVVADAPCPGLLDSSFLLRNAWTCLDGMASNDRRFSALLDWSLETIVQAYERMLERLPVAPDILVYGDDLGFQQSMFLSDADFRKLLRPRLQLLVSRLRQLTSAALCFHSCGAIRPILPDICDLGVDIINLDCTARGMACSELRRQLPKRLVFHGCSDLVALGRAVRCGNLASVALLTSEIVDSMPMIAAPVDSLSTSTDIDNAQLAAQFLRELAPDDIAAMAQLGPIRSVIESAVHKARAAELSAPLGMPPEFIPTGAPPDFEPAPASRHSPSLQDHLLH